MAHLGYFERVYVRERQWLTPHHYAELLALCQIIPGPASSQLGFLIGLHRAGYRGALAAWLGFTLPSALLLFFAAGIAGQWRGHVADSVFHGLKLVAVAVVAQAVWSMGRRLWRDRFTASIGMLAVAVALFWNEANASMVVLGLGALLGVFLCRSTAPGSAVGHSVVRRPVAWAAGGAFLILLLGLPALAWRSPQGPLALAETFYRAGALVFGGGHVVLPLLRDALVPGGWLTEDSFLAGYGLAQAVPGPLFTVAAYLGAVNVHVGPPVLGACIALIAIFLPGLLLAVASIALWKEFAAFPGVRGALAGVNSAVVGVLGAALYSPVLTTSVHTLADGLVALIAFALLERWRVQPIGVALLCVAAALAQGAWT